MIFLAGIHGVGKTTLCKRINSELHLQCYTASALIEMVSAAKMNSDKRVEAIEDNQKLLLQAVRNLKRQSEFLLEGIYVC